MNTITSIVDIPDAASLDNTQADAYLIITIESLTRYREITHATTLGEAKFIAFGQLAHSRGTEDIRIIRVEDKPLYDTVASDNYRASWSGNIRSGEKDTSQDWQNPAGFPWLHRGEDYVPSTPWA